MCAALQQQIRQIEFKAQSAKVDDAEVQQMADQLQQFQVANSELQSQLADQVRRHVWCYDASLLAGAATAQQCASAVV